jgi:hypothetical protein
MMSEKMLTFEEWTEHFSWREITWRNAFELARQGMMPVPPMEGYEKWNPKHVDHTTRKDVWEAAIAWAESSGRYILVPDVERWDRTATSMVLVEVCEGDEVIDVIQRIPRPTPPTPPWKPKVGDWVWHKTNKVAGRVEKVDNKGLVHYGEYAVDKIEDLAPFDPAKIGEVEK